MTTRRPLLFDLLTTGPEASSGPAPGLPAAGTVLRESLRKELELLFTSTALAASEPFEHLSHASRSTLNYGLPDLAGKTASSLDHKWLAAQLTQAIRLFEPRLQAESVRVHARPHRALSHNVVSFEIDACVVHPHGSEAIELDSELDLESGAARVMDRPRARRPEPEARG